MKRDMSITMAAPRDRNTFYSFLNVSISSSFVPSRVEAKCDSELTLCGEIATTTLISGSSNSLRNSSVLCCWISTASAEVTHPEHARQS